jgi:hypothetical protein
MLPETGYHQQAKSDDFVAFAKLYQLTPVPGRLHFIGHVNKIHLFLGLQ